MPACAPAQTVLKLDAAEFGNAANSAKAVLESLANPEWDFRTVEGISQETKLTPEEVDGILRTYPQLVRTSHVRDRQGRPLYTLRNRPSPLTETLAFIRSIITKTV